MSGDYQSCFFDPASYKGDKITSLKISPDDTVRYHGYKPCDKFVLHFKSGRKLRFLIGADCCEHNYFLIPKGVSLTGKTIGELKECPLEDDDDDTNDEDDDNYTDTCVAMHLYSLELNDDIFYFYRVCESNGYYSGWFHVEEGRT
jgi:hypothetical protein